MRLFKILFVFILLGFIFRGCGGGGSSDDSGFVPTGKIIAIAERSGSNIDIKVGGTAGAAPPGSKVEVTNLNTTETLSTTAESDGSFDPTFKGSTSDRFSVAVDGMIVTGIPIGVTLISEAVKRNLAQLGSIPSAIEIQENRAYVVNGGFNNVQIFDLNQQPPKQIGTIVLPPGSDPVSIAFIDNTRAYVANLTGQSVAIVNVQTMQCERLIVRSDSVPSNIGICQNQVTAVGPELFEDPMGIAVANGKVYVSNNNLAPNPSNPFNLDPLGPGFLTVINAMTNEVFGTTIELSADNAQGITVVGDRLYVVSAGDPEFVGGLFFANTPGAIDIINPETDEREDSIPIPLNPDLPLVGFAGRLEPTPDEKFGYIGSGTSGVLFKVNLQSKKLVRGTGDPIIVTSAEQQDATFDVEIGDDGLAFIPVFNIDQVFVMDTKNDFINPFPFIAPFPVGIRGDEPSSDFFEGPQDLVIRPGTPGVDFQGADIFFITAIFGTEKLGSINKALILPPE